MFLALITHYVVDDYVTCNAGFEEDKQLRSYLPKSLIQLADNEEDTDNDPQPFRVCFDTTSIDDYTADPGQCSANQYVDNCQMSEDGDYLNDAKRKTIKETFANVQSFLQDNINVSRLKTGVKINQYYLGNLKITYKDEADELAGRMSDCDIFIPVLARPFGAGSSGLAYASSNTYASGSERPVQGSITVNPAKIPSEPQNFESGQRQFLSTVLHEINHVLSFSGSLFDRWKDSDGNRYDPIKWEPVAKEDNPYRIQHIYIKTPHLLNWVNDRFHIDDAELKTYGLELEDGGSTGTAFSHPNERLFFTDLMQGRIYGPGYISGMFYNTLWDTGWYRVSEEVTEDMAYLDDSIFPSTRINQSIINQPPILTFPSEYLCKDSSTPTCFYDSVYVGICSLISSSKIETDAEYETEQKAWYNPKGASSVGSDNLLDYAPLILPWVNCRDPTHTAKRYESSSTSAEESVATYGETFSDTSICASSSLTTAAIAFGTEAHCFDSWCGTDNKVRIIVGEIERLCKYDYQSLSFSGYRGSIQCPPAAAACANRHKRQVLNVQSLFPDRGPIDGRNLVSVNGYGFDRYDTDDLNISIGPIPCRIISKKDSYILCQIDELTAEQQKSEVYKQQPFHATILSLNDSSSYESMYVYTNRHYDSVLLNASPLVAILGALTAITAVIVFFF